MAIACGLVGLPNAGKSSIFNCITSGGAATAPYAFTTITPNTGTVAVPDRRLERLADLVKPGSIVPASIEVVDIAGLVKGASKGEGLGNRFLGHIREVDAIIHVVRLHSEANVPHHGGGISPAMDAGIVNLELELADLETVQRRRQRIGKAARYGERKDAEEDRILAKIEEALSRGLPARRVPLDAAEQLVAAGLFLITMKPVVYVGNLPEGTSAPDSSPLYRELSNFASAEGAPVTALSAKIEAEVAQLGEPERSAFLSDLGIEVPGGQKVIRAAYEALDYITFYTFNEKEARAWPLKRGACAPRAAGKIHSDMEKGFVKAEVVSMTDLERAGSFPAARERGLARIEGKEYEIQDGDVVFFRFTG